MHPVQRGPELVDPYVHRHGVGAGFMLVGIRQMLASPADRPAYGSTVVVAAACFALYRRLPQSVLLVAGVLGIAVAPPEAVWDWDRRRGRRRGDPAGRRVHSSWRAPSGWSCGGSAPVARAGEQLSPP
jgi:hypothetical protein